jgi:hypothetical protein
VLGEVDIPCPPFAEELDDSVGADHGTGLERRHFSLRLVL